MLVEEAGGERRRVGRRARGKTPGPLSPTVFSPPFRAFRDCSGARVSLCALLSASTTRHSCLSASWCRRRSLGPPINTHAPFSQRATCADEARPIWRVKKKPLARAREGEGPPLACGSCVFERVCSRALEGGGEEDAGPSREQRAAPTRAPAGFWPSPDRAHSHKHIPPSRAALELCPAASGCVRAAPALASRTT